MNLIETLMAEHRVIEQALDGLERWTERLRAGEDLPREALAELVAFFREYADGIHHSKEEDALFAAMVEHGFPRDGGPVAVMLSDHEQGRALVGELAEAAAGAGPWSDAERSEVAGAAASYAAMLRAHILKEDRILYPMARAHVPEQAMSALDERCAALDSKRVAAIEKHQRMVEGLRSVEAAAAARPPHRGHSCTCQH